MSVIFAKDDNFPEIWKLLLPCSNDKVFVKLERIICDSFWYDKSFENLIRRKEKYCQVANKAAKFVRLLSVSGNSRGDTATS